MVSDLSSAILGLMTNSLADMIPPDDFFTRFMKEGLAKNRHVSDTVYGLYRAMYERERKRLVHSGRG